MNNRMSLLRKELGLSQTEFANEIGATQATISRHEKKNTIPYELLNTINEKFKINLNWLVLGKGEMFEQSMNLVTDTRIKDYFNKLKKRKNNELLSEILEMTFIENHLIKNGQNPDQIYFNGINKSELTNLECYCIQYLNMINRKYIILECEELTINQILQEILNKLEIEIEKKTDNWLSKRFYDVLYFQDLVIIFKELSTSRTKNIEVFFREFIKILDDAHLKNIKPRADLIFIDYPSFYEKNQELISSYLKTNIIS